MTTNVTFFGTKVTPLEVLTKLMDNVENIETIMVVCSSKDEHLTYLRCSDMEIGTGLFASALIDIHVKSYMEE